MADADPLNADPQRVDPRFDPVFQRGYDPSRDRDRGPTGTGDRRGASTLAPARAPATAPVADAAPAPDWVASAPDVDARGERPVEPETDAAHPDATAAADDVPVAASRTERGILVALLVLSTAVAIAGLVGVLVLSSKPPLALALAATTQSSAGQLTLELLSGPALTVGAVGVAVTLALVAATGVRERR